MKSNNRSEQNKQPPFFQSFYNRNNHLINICSYLFAITGIFLQINSPFTELRMLTVSIFLITALLFVFIIVKFLVAIVLLIDEGNIVANQFFGILTLLLIIFVFKNLFVSIQKIFPQEFSELVWTSLMIIIIGSAALHEDLRKFLDKRYKKHDAFFLQHLYLFVLFSFMCATIKPDLFYNARSLPAILGVAIATIIASITITTLFSCIFFIKNKLLEISWVNKLVKQINDG